MGAGGGRLSKMFGKTLEVAGLRFDDRTGELTDGSRMVRIEPRAGAVLAELWLAQGALVSRDTLLDRCWAPGSGSDEALTQAVAQIRRAFETLGHSQPVETLAKRGYRLRPDLSGTEQTIAAVRDPRRPLVLWAIALGTLLILTITQTHALGHAVRHALGFGPIQTTGAARH